MDTNETKLSDTIKEDMGDIRSVNKYCPYDTCGNGYCNTASQVIVYALDTRLFVLTCSRCNGTWYLCRVCTNITYPLRNLNAVKCHMNRCHHPDTKWVSHLGFSNFN